MNIIPLVRISSHNLSDSSGDGGGSILGFLIIILIIGFVLWKISPTEEEKKEKAQKEKERIRYNKYIEDLEEHGDIEWSDLDGDDLIEETEIDEDEFMF